jgi:hypothetical protein
MTRLKYAIAAVAFLCGTAMIQRELKENAELIKKAGIKPN